MSISSAQLNAHMAGKAVTSHTPGGKRKHGELVAACLNVLALKGIFAWKNQTGTLQVQSRWVSFGTPGSPDIIGILPGGRFIGVEVKVGRDKVSRVQATFHEAIRYRGGVIVVVHDNVDELLQAIKQEQ
jgi:hypothetical protein